MANAAKEKRSMIHSRPIVHTKRNSDWYLMCTAVNSHSVHKIRRRAGWCTPKPKIMYTKEEGELVVVLQHPQPPIAHHCKVLSSCPETAHIYKCLLCAMIGWWHVYVQSIETILGGTNLIHCIVFDKITGSWESMLYNIVSILYQLFWWFGLSECSELVMF